TKLICNRQRATIVRFALLYIRWVLTRCHLAQELEAPRSMASFSMLFGKLKSSSRQQGGLVKAACHKICFALPVNAERLTGNSSNGECFGLGLLSNGKATSVRPVKA